MDGYWFGVRRSEQDRGGWPVLDLRWCRPWVEVTLMRITPGEARGLMRDLVGEADRADPAGRDEVVLSGAELFRLTSDRDHLLSMLENITAYAASLAKGYTPEFAERVLRSCDASRALVAGVVHEAAL